MQCVSTNDGRQAPIPFDAGAVVGISVRIVLLQEIRLGRGKLDSDRRTGRRGKRERERREHGVELSLREALGRKDAGGSAEERCSAEVLLEDGLGRDGGCQRGERRVREY